MVFVSAQRRDLGDEGFRPRALSSFAFDHPDKIFGQRAAFPPFRLLWRELILGISIGDYKDPKEPPSSLLSLRLDVTLPVVAPSTPLRGFVRPRPKLDRQSFHTSRRTACRQGTISSSMAESRSNKWIVEFWMAVLP